VLATESKGFVSEVAGLNTEGHPRSLARPVPWVVMGIACLALMGWALDVHYLTSFNPKSVRMNPLTAVCFLAAAVALYGRLKWRRSSPAVAFLSAFVAAIGTVKVSEYLLGWQSGFDQILFQHKLAADSWPNRMAPNTAADFVLIGTCLLLFHWRTRNGRYPSQFLALAAGTIPVMALIGYAYNV